MKQFNSYFYKLEKQPNVTRYENKGSVPLSSAKLCAEKSSVQIINSEIDCLCVNNPETRNQPLLRSISSRKKIINPCDRDNGLKTRIVALWAREIWLRLKQPTAVNLPLSDYQHGDGRVSQNLPG